VLFGRKTVDKTPYRADYNVSHSTISRVLSTWRLHFLGVALSPWRRVCDDTNT
jgi:hypothetical protein